MFDSITLRTLRRAVLVTVAGVAAVGAGACSDSTSSPPTSPSDNVAGNFSLHTVNTQSLPFSIFSETDYKLDITSGSAALDTNGTFVIATTTRETVAGQVSTYVDSTRGTYTQNEGNVGFTLTPGGTTGTAAWTGTTLTFVQADVLAGTTTTYVYRKNR